jgi:hypothetical protein
VLRAAEVRPAEGTSLAARARSKLRKILQDRRAVPTRARLLKMIWLAYRRAFSFLQSSAPSS